MAQSARIDELRKKLEREPGSPLFAQLAEELRRAGELGEAIRVSREGLLKLPTYATARITLARALASSGDAAGARGEFEAVLRAAPDNVIAQRGLADLGSDGARAWGDGVAAPRAAATVADAGEEHAAVGSGVAPTELAAPEPEPPLVVDAVSGKLAAPAAEGAVTAPARDGSAGEDEEYELEPVRAAVAAGPPQLTFRPLLDEGESERAPAMAVAEAVPDRSGTVTSAPVAAAERTRDDKPAGVELASPTLAELYFGQGAFERSAQVYEELLSRDPGNARLAVRLREAQARIGTKPDRGQHGKREELLRRAIVRLEELRSRFAGAAATSTRGAGV